jgi:hypothetical protein
MSMDQTPRGFEGLTRLLPPANFAALFEAAKQSAAAMGEAPATPQTKPQAAPPKIIRDRSAPRWVWWIGGMVVLGLIGSSLDDHKSPSSSRTAPSSSTSYTAPSWSTAIETMPAAGRNNLLSYAEIRYCLSQKYRLTDIQGWVSPSSDYEIGQFNRLVDDYNARCGSYRYSRGALENVQQQVDANRTELSSQAYATVQSWRR